MLRALSIRRIVIVDALDLEFDAGLMTLTGETGAGKSILLDSLGLALGARADAGLVQPGADGASVTATFDLLASHPAWTILADAGVAASPETDSGLLLLRRAIGADGRSRAFVNDLPVSVALLKAVGDSVAEVHGQFEQHGLLNPARHREILDAAGGLMAAAVRVQGSGRPGAPLPRRWPTRKHGRPPPAATKIFSATRLRNCAASRSSRARRSDWRTSGRSRWGEAA